MTLPSFQFTCKTQVFTSFRRGKRSSNNCQLKLNLASTLIDCVDDKRTVTLFKLNNLISYNEATNFILYDIESRLSLINSNRYVQDFDSNVTHNTEYSNKLNLEITK